MHYPAAGLGKILSDLTHAPANVPDQAVFLAMLDSMRAHNIYPIARIVVVKDPLVLGVGDDRRRRGDVCAAV